MNEVSILAAFIGSFFASLGFGVLFNIKGKFLFFAGLAGAIGGAVYQLFVNMDLSAAFANFMGAVAFSLSAEILARVLKTTVTTFTAPALIPLVPGGTIYKMMVQLMQNNIYKGMQLGVEAMAVAGALALGMMLVSVLTRLYYWIIHKFEHKPA